jgi:hypothetical protein
MSIMHPARQKRASNHSHAKQRCYDRYDLDLTEPELEGLAEDAGSPAAVPLRRDPFKSNRVWVAVWHDRSWLPVVYDEATRSIVTFLPWHAIEPYHKVLDRLAKERTRASPRDDIPPPGTILGTIDVAPRPKDPEYRPPDEPCRTLGEAVHRVHALNEILRNMRADIKSSERRRLTDRVAALIAAREIVRAEATTLQGAIERTVRRKRGRWRPPDSTPLAEEKSS